MKIKYSNITFIGMAGVGKSTFGKLIAKENNYNFIDVDTLIEENEKIKIKDYISKFSEKKFIEKEESTILKLKFSKNCIIATGGSAIYSDKAMKYLKQHSKIVFLNDTIENIKKRITDFNSRGMITNGHNCLESLFNSRLPLYNKYLDITVNMPKELSIENGLKEIYKYIKWNIKQ